ncbi:MAG: arylsulfatase [Reichenbachiella sp.]
MSKIIKRHQLLQFTVFHFMCTIAMFGCVNNLPTPKKPNVILIVADDQGWGDLSIHGNPNIQTPNIDAIALSGASFSNFYVSPVCSPTRAEILTGRYASRGGVYSTSAGGERLNLDEITIADVFRENGYETAAFGKWHNGMQYPYHPNGRGFNEFYGFCSGHWGNYFNPMLERNGEIVKGNGFLTDDLVSEALSFIKHKKENPFFVYLPLNTPHSPMQVPDKDWDKFKNKQIDSTHRFSAREDLEHTKAAYALCENIDWNVGRITTFLDQEKLSKNTIVIYMSDNGPNGWRYNGGLKGIKAHTDEGGVKVPFFIKWDNVIPKNLTIKNIAGAIDILPTLKELTGIAFTPEKSIDGLNLKPLLFGESIEWPDRSIVSYWKGRSSLRTQKFRLDHNNALFDMQVDPLQEKDISNESPAIKNQLIIRKEQWEKDVLAELPIVDNRSFPVGHPDFIYTQLPARDGLGHGNILRSNKYPNCSFFTNWISQSDSITWDIEVLESGTFEAAVYYTCKEQSIGTEVIMSFGNNSVSKEISIAHNPPLIGAKMDRVNRQESYVKEFIPLNLGQLKLEKGSNSLKLSTSNMSGEEVMDVRLVMLKRII